jgi:tRNA threonylcarbamoyladenosine biosynthesis protein TsaE
MSTFPTSPNSVTLETRSPEETRRVALAITPILLPGDVLALSGDLGAGKTTFVQGLAAGLRIPERVTSPTFILMREYFGGRYPLVHMDIYRLSNMQEVIDLGYEEFLDPGHIIAVEWGDAIEPLLPRDHLLVELSYNGDISRQITITARGPAWRSRMPTVRILTSELFSPHREHDGLERQSPFNPETER